MILIALGANLPGVAGPPMAQLDAALASLAARTVDAQGVRARMRVRPRGTTVTDSQASELTLTLTKVETRPVQTWVRTAGTVDATGQVLTTHLGGLEATLVKPGQRARAFPVESRSSMYQSRVANITPERGGVRVEVRLIAPGRPGATSYLVEIVVERGDFLSVPNEAIIEEGATQVVYVQRNGQYEPQKIQAGIQGELYTQVLGGVRDGDQVVTFGSFFIDSEYKLKGGATQARQ